ncbi:Gag-Pro-Pol polyprotein, partial [Lemmus lemmus]
RISRAVAWRLLPAGSAKRSPCYLINFNQIWLPFACALTKKIFFSVFDLCPRCLPEPRLCFCDRRQSFYDLPVPTYNNSQPAKRYQWTVLPQGMLNSPALCQYFVSQPLEII